MKRKKLIAIAAAVVVVVLALTDCSGPKPQVKNEEITIAGLPNGDVVIDMNYVMGAKTFEGRVEGADSKGKPVIFDIKGAYFSDILEKHGYDQKHFEGLRLVAKDGYSIQVPKEILETRDIILAYELNGESIYESSAPVRVFIPDERAMYWVKMVNRIEMIAEQAEDTASAVYFVQTIYDEDDLEDFEYYDETYRALNTTKVLADYPGTGGDVVLMMSSDGLFKNEKLENFYKGVISLTSEDSPEFISNTLPNGMFVKQLKFFKYGGSAFYFATAQGDKQVSLASFIEDCSLAEADEYTLVFKDGSEITVEKDRLDEIEIKFTADGETGVLDTTSSQMYQQLSLIK